MMKKIIYIIIAILFITSCGNNNFLADNWEIPEANNQNSGSLDGENSYEKEIVPPTESTNFNINIKLWEK